MHAGSAIRCTISANKLTSPLTHAMQDISISPWYVWQEAFVMPGGEQPYVSQLVPCRAGSGVHALHQYPRNTNLAP
jgi:hypothetical protein